jgi:hypothetical protein
MKVSLAQLEARLQALIEGSAARLFPSGDRRPGNFEPDTPGRNLASRMVEAMRSNLRTKPDGTFWAPNLFVILVHPTRVAALGESRALLDDLAQALQQAGAEGDVRFYSPPTIRVAPDPELGARELRIQAAFVHEQLMDTSSLENRLRQPDQEAHPGGFLIIEGSQIFPIERPVINIGRSSRNDLVVDDRRVSREHAQLRLIHGRYVIFDLDSTGGTFVNGQRSIESVLYPGDVISLAGVSMIFNQDSPSSTGETQPYPPE